MRKVFRRMAVGVKNAAHRINSKVVLAIGAMMGFAANAVAQDPGAGLTGLTTAEGHLESYVDPVCNIVMIIGGIVGIVGAIRVFTKWQNGDQDVTKSLMAWLGSCVFLVVGALVVKAFFGLG